MVVVFSSFDGGHVTTTIHKKINSLFPNYSHINEGSLFSFKYLSFFNEFSIALAAKFIEANFSNAGNVGILYKNATQ